MVKNNYNDHNKSKWFYGKVDFSTRRKTMMIIMIDLLDLSSTQKLTYYKKTTNKVLMEHISRIQFSLALERIETSQTVI